MYCLHSSQQRTSFLIFTIRTSLTARSCGSGSTTPFFPKDLGVHHRPGHNLAAAITSDFREETYPDTGNLRGTNLLWRLYSLLVGCSRIIESAYSLNLYTTALGHIVAQHSSQILHDRIRIATRHGGTDGQFIRYFVCCYRFPHCYGLRIPQCVYLLLYSFKKCHNTQCFKINKIRLLSHTNSLRYQNSAREASTDIPLSLQIRCCKVSTSTAPRQGIGLYNRPLTTN